MFLFTRLHTFYFYFSYLLSLGQFDDAPICSVKPLNLEKVSTKVTCLKVYTYCVCVWVGGGGVGVGMGMLGCDIFITLNSNNINIYCMHHYCMIL